jgi:DNA-binding transcriptional ArsR family regulator
LVPELLAAGHEVVGPARSDASAAAPTAEVAVSRQAVSKHLSVLQRVGLIDRHRQGREVRYEVREQRLAEQTHAEERASSATPRATTAHRRTD